MEFKCENGNIDCLFSTTERLKIIDDVKAYYKRQFIKDDEINKMPRLKAIALKELLDGRLSR